MCESGSTPTQAGDALRDNTGKPVVDCLFNPAYSIVSSTNTVWHLTQGLSCVLYWINPTPGR